jgi:hypothetical protein
MQTPAPHPPALTSDDVAVVPPLDTTAWRRFLGGAAPSVALGLAVGVDPRVPLLPAAEQLIERLTEAPVGLRLHVVTALPGDGRSTLAHQVAARLAARRELAVVLWTRAAPFDVELALAHATTDDSAHNSATASRVRNEMPVSFMIPISTFRASCRCERTCSTRSSPQPRSSRLRAAAMRACGKALGLPTTLTIRDSAACACSRARFLSSCWFFAVVLGIPD